MEKKHLSPNHRISDDKNRWFVDYSKVKGEKKSPRSGEKMRQGRIRYGKY